MATEDGSAFGRVSDEKVREATGQEVSDWLHELDHAGAREWDHKAIVAHLVTHHPEVSGWWRQTIAVGYERARGKRAVGQTADAGFQVGVTRSVEATPDEVWEALVSRPELWLGKGASLTIEEGEHYSVSDADAASGEIRVVRPGTRLRMTWQPAAWERPATVQLTLSSTPSGKTAVGAHLEKLPDAEAREEMREHWRGALERIIAALR